MDRGHAKQQHDHDNATRSHNGPNLRCQRRQRGAPMGDQGQRRASAETPIVPVRVKAKAVQNGGRDSSHCARAAHVQHSRSASVGRGV